MLRPEAAIRRAANQKTKKNKGRGGLKTPSGGTIRHDSDGEEEPVPADFFDSNGGSGPPAAAAVGEDATLPEGFFDDPVQDAKVRGIEYKVKPGSSVQTFLFCHYY